MCELIPASVVTLAERLRRVIRNHMGFPRAGSNPAGVALFLRIGAHSRRLWCSGYHVWFPTMRPGFDSRLAHILSQRKASMAEWSKALDLSSSIRKNAWVRTPLEASILGGSVTKMSSWPNWIRRETTNLEIGGSSPSEDAIPLCSRGLVGYDDCLTRSRSPVRSRARVSFVPSQLGPMV